MHGAMGIKDRRLDILGSDINSQDEIVFRSQFCILLQCPAFML
jgi:hypothetical protein